MVNISYGATSLPGGASSSLGRSRSSKRVMAALALLSVGCIVLVAMSAYSATVGDVMLRERRPKMQIITTEDGRQVAVPPLEVNYAAGTTASYHSEFERSAADKAARATQLFQEKLGANKFVSFAGNSVPLPPMKVNFSKGTLVSYNGEFDSDIMSKSRTQQLAADSKKAQFGMSAKAASKDADMYFRDQAFEAAMKRAVPKAIEFSGKAARRDAKGYFAKEAVAAGQKHQQQLKLIPPHAHRAADKAPKFGDSASAAKRDIDSYFQGQAAAAARKHKVAPIHHAAAAAPKHVKADKFGLSAKAADAEIDSYFASEASVAKATRSAKHLLKQEPAPKVCGDSLNAHFLAASLSPALSPHPSHPPPTNALHSQSHNSTHPYHLHACARHRIRVKRLAL